MNSYILMLQADPDDRHLTETTLQESFPELNIRYLDSAADMNSYCVQNGQPSLILLNDEGTITERGQVLKWIKSHPSYGHIPVVVLGEQSSGDYVMECYRAGASTFITKPSSMKATKEKIEAFFSYWLHVADV